MSRTTPSTSSLSDVLVVEEEDEALTNEVTTTITTTAPKSSPKNSDRSRSSSPTTSSSLSTSEDEIIVSLLHFPVDLQVHILTYLRAYDLSALNQTCKFYCNPNLIHAVIAHFADEIYPSQFTNGFVAGDSVSTGTTVTITTSTTTSKKAAATTVAALKPAPLSSEQKKQQQNIKPVLYTFQHLRNMELLVVARVLNSPEPSGNGFFVSKSWCKTALKWLEVQQQEQQERQAQQHHAKNNSNKKLSKKKQRLRNRKLSDAHPPWPNANSDLLCEHDQLQRCSNGKSARARRRLLDKQAWKILKKLYPDSTPIDSVVGECVQCRAEAETTKKNAERHAALAKLERQGPVLDNAILRAFYLRRSGVPSQALTVGTATIVHEEDQESTKMSPACCPLKEGNYFVLPRAWCYAWRRYIKTGELPVLTSTSSSCNNNNSNISMSPPPDASCLLCHKHRLALLPPHLEAYLYGESPELIDPPPLLVVVGRLGGVVQETGDESNNNIIFPFARAAAAAPLAAPDNIIIVPGQGPDPEALRAMRHAGLNDVEVSRQLSLLQQFQDQRRVAAAAVAEQEQQESAASAAARRRLHNDRLDRENHTVVEIVTAQEYACLEDLWNNSNKSSGGGTFSHRAVGFQLGFDVDAHGRVHFLTTTPCRACDATGRHGNSAAGYHHHQDQEEDGCGRHHPEQSSARRSKKNRGRGYVAKEAVVEY